MKATALFLMAILLRGFVVGQVTLTTEEHHLLKAICEQYNVPKKESTLKAMQKTASGRFQGFIGQMMMVKGLKGDVLDTTYLRRPTHEELVFWYAVREFHYNNAEPDSLQVPKEQIMGWVLKDTVDKRWLLDNYYYRISAPLSMLFNEADLSKYDFQVDKLGFQDETEKAIFFLFLMHSCGDRLSVMAFTRKGDPKSVIKRLPKVNGQPYFHYADFDYPDFQWVGHKKLESYNDRHLGSYYGMLLNHLNILLENGAKEEAERLVKNSILSQPELFQYSGSSATLQKVYETWK
ncbi:MAG: hypothetical protein IPJ76_07105 [Flavobacteriales bacterium]|nr:MAG: hypothetical protein IPJ76_07105 [Flavobacteriales bacterium]